MCKISDNNLSVLVCLALVLVTFAVFYQVHTFEFVNYDDPLYVYGNLNIQQGITLKSIKWAFTSNHASNWHPLTWLSHMLDWHLFGRNPEGHHMNNLILHIANTLLLFLVLRQMTNALWQSAFVAALFALHPLHVESVAWVAERKDVLSAFFWMLTMFAYLRYVKQPCVINYVQTLLAFSLGLMSKPMLVTLPFVLLLLDYWPLERLQFRQTIENKKDSECKTGCFHRSSVYRLLIEKLPFFALSAVSSVITFIVQQRGGAMSTENPIPFVIRIANALVSYVSYISKMFYPSRLAVLYPYPTSKFPIWQPLLCLILLALVTAIIIYNARSRRYMLVGWLWYLGTLVPVIGLVQVGIQAMADRYTYLPSIGIFIIVAWGAAELFKRLHLHKIIPAVSAAAIIFALFLCTKTQLRYWRDSLALFGHAARVTRDNYIMHNNYGNALSDNGRFNDAIAHLKQSIRINPKYAKAYINLGVAYNLEGNTKQAVENWNTALKIEPNSIEALNNLAWLRAVQINSEFYDPNTAVQLALRACEKTQYKKPQILDTLAVAYAATGNFHKAIETLEKALELCQSPTQNKVREQLEERLIRFKASKPYIEAQ
jgi:tetratricopeptide (TPR) repeat protein